MAPLGVEANEPAVKAYCKISSQEKATMIEAILQQKVGANAKNFKQFAEFQRAKEQDQRDGIQEVRNMLVRKARVAKGATVRWKRTFAGNKKQEEGDDERNDHEEKKATIQVQDVGMHEVRAPTGDSMDAVANAGRIQRYSLPKLRQARA